MSSAAPALKLLMVEDSEADAALVLRQFQKDGIAIDVKRVENARDLEAALDGSSWDLVLSDFSLPAFNGHEAIKIVRGRSPDLPVIIVSGTIGEEAAVDVLKAGANDYVLKDRLARLIPAVKRELREANERAERQKVEAKLRETEKQLQQSQKLEAVGRLVGGVAHDFNNALAIIGLHCDALVDGPFEKDAIVDRVQKVSKAQARAAALTRQLLTFSRKTPFPPRAVNAAAVINETCDLMKRLVGAHIRIEIDVAPDLRPIWADQTQLEQILMNLIVNSRDAMATGGVLSICAQSAAKAPAGMDAGAVRILVSDTGCGIPREILPRITEPFFSTKEAGKGTGLGLAIVNKIVRQNGAQLDIRSQVGKGTEIEIHWPCAPLNAPMPANTMAEPIRARGKSQKVLLVEVEGPLRDLLAECLQGSGYNVVAASDGEQALKVAESAPVSEIEIVLTDPMIPKMSGGDLVKNLRARNPNIKVLFMSGLGRPEIDVSEGVHSIEKPFSKSSLLDRIGQILA